MLCTTNKLTSFNGRKLKWGDKQKRAWVNQPSITVNDNLSL